MRGSFDEPDDSATPLTTDEKEGLIPDFVITRRELNRFEQKNIVSGQRWAFARRRNVLDVDFLRELHRRMFDDVWEWAGTFRTTPRNIGVEAHDIAPELRKLVDDVKAQIQHGSYPPDDIAIRFHHRLVAIHPFPNGNGRHGRLATDLLARQLGTQRFEWGAPADLMSVTDIRKAYIAALKALDRGDVLPLKNFLRPTEK
jgi:Fic-DOC domain mobile mystery protein B